MFDFRVVTQWVTAAIMLPGLVLPSATSPNLR